jgi:hypothetical protein
MFARVTRIVITNPRHAQRPMMDCTSRKRSVVRSDGVVVTLSTKKKRQRNRRCFQFYSGCHSGNVPAAVGRFFAAVNPSQWPVRWKIEDGICSGARLCPERDVECSTMKYGGRGTAVDNRIR